MSPTNFLPPQAVISNGVVTGNQWQNTENIYFVDGKYVSSDANQGSASDFCIGNFNFDIPVGSIIQGIEIKIIGLTGSPTSPPISLDVSYFKDTNGANAYFPYTAPITSLTPTLSTITIGSPTYLFATTWTVDQINNFKLSLIANGDIMLDCVLVKVYFVPPATNTLQYNTLTGTFDVDETITDTFSGATATVVTDNASNQMTVTNVVGNFFPGDPITGGTSGATALLDSATPGVCIDCSSPIQVQAMELALPFLIGQTAFYLKAGSFAYPNGIPVQPGDLGSCGGTIPWVFDESKAKGNGQNFEENAMLDTNNGGSWSVLASGIIKVELGSVTQRGRDYKTPGNHVDANMSNHDTNSKVIISNNEPYNLTLIRKCQADTVFSVPISVYDEAVLLTASLHKIIFTGPGVTASLSALHEITVTINGGGGGGGITSINGDTTAAQTIVAGAGISVSTVAGATTITNTGGGGSAYNLFQNTGSSVTARTTVNLTNLLTASDVGGKTQLDINISNLAHNATFINDLTSDTLFQTNVNAFVTGGSGSNTITVTSGNTLTGGTLPQPVVFGDGVTYNFFNHTTSGSVTDTNVGDVTARTKQTLTFKVLDGNVVLVNRLRVFVQSITGTSNLICSIQTTSSGNPTGTILASVSFPSSGGGAPGFLSGLLNTQLELTAPSGGGDVVYAIVIETNLGVDPSNFWQIASENNGGSNTAPYLFNGSTWSPSNFQPQIELIYTYATNTAFLSAQVSGARMQSVLVNSSGGQPISDVVPSILQNTHGFITTNASIGGSVSAIISGAVAGFTGLTIGQYISDRSDGHITSGSSGNISGRALTTTQMVIIPN